MQSGPSIHRPVRLSLTLSYVALTAIAAGPAFAAAAKPTLCKADELIVFSCPTGAHTASICASKDVSKNGGYMQYRYGRQDNVDLAYPDLGAKPADVFMSGTMIFSGGGGALLRFNRSQFSYTIFTAVGKWGRSGGIARAAGVAVEKDGKQFANFPCRADPTSEIGPDFFDKLGLKTAFPASEFDIPTAFLPK
jgi:hypothetical protein